MAVYPIPPRWFTTAKGLAYCDLVIDRGDHSDLQWVCTVFPAGECWTFSNYEVRAAKNLTLGLDNPTDLRPRT